MADAVDQGSLAKDDLEGAREERDSAVADERGLPESDANENPLPLHAIDEMVNKAEGDHEALAENAYQEKVVRETDGVEFNGLTSVEEALRDQQREDISDETDGKARFGADANSPAEASSDSSSDSSDGPDATDAARSLAAERGVDLSEVKGTGADGRITKDDVESHTSA